MYGLLIPTVPALMRAASRWPRAGSPVQTVAIRPYRDVVRDPDRVRLVLERDHRDDRAEDLLLRDLMRVVDARDDRGG